MVVYYLFVGVGGDLGDDEAGDDADDDGDGGSMYGVLGVFEEGGE